MNQIFKQETRLGRLATVLGEDVLVLLRFRGTDTVNALFEYQIDALSTVQNIDFDALIGTHATVEIDSLHHGSQRFDGIVTQAAWAGVGENGNKYTLTLRPWLWLAGKRRNQRIFHEKSVVQIIEEVLSAYSGLGSPHLDVRLKRDYRTLEYTVQYRETDLAFVTRQMERFGISYHFVHDEGSHSLVLTDHVEDHDPLPGDTRPYFGVDGHHSADEEHFWEWHPERNLTTGAIRLTDWNFKTPMASMEVDQVGDAAHAEGQIESYDFPGDYLDQGVGKDVVRLRTEQERAQDARHRAIGDCTCLKSGMTLGLTGEQVPGVKGSAYLCLSATHNFVSEGYGSGTPMSDEYAFTGSYVFAPSTAPLAPERVTPRPIVHGPQTAVVVGEGEIDCDEYGRILVHFPWDLQKAYSMRCRVSQNWASKGWGGMVIPRIGMEVVVEFIEGDPDMPLVTGCVYNGKNDVPYPLPEHKTKSVFRSDSHKSTGFNEFTFEDATGEENISLHAQKDQTLKVLNNRSKRVDNDQTESVGQNKSIDVGKNHQEKIGGSMNLSVGAGAGIALFAGLAGLMGMSSKAGKNGAGESGDGFVGQFLGGMEKVSVAAEAVSLPANKTFTDAAEFRQIAGKAQLNAGAAVGALVGHIMPISGVKTTIVEKAQSDTIGLARTEQIGLFKNTFVGKVQNTVVGTKQMTEVGETKTIDVGKHMEINVGEDFIVTVGKSRLIMTKEGTIVLQGVKIEVEGEKQIRAQAKLIDLN